MTPPTAASGQALWTVFGKFGNWVTLSGLARALPELLLVLLGMKLGEGCAIRGTSAAPGAFAGQAELCCKSSFGVEGPDAFGKFADGIGIGGALAMDMRLIRRASVGEIVRAPSPLVRPDTVDCRLLAELPEEGVRARSRLPCDLAPRPARSARSGVSGYRLRLVAALASRGGGCMLLTLAARLCVFAVDGASLGRSWFSAELV